MLHLSRLIGQPVRDSSADTIGVIDDLIAAVGTSHPPITGLVVRTGRRRIYLGWSSVERMDAAGATILATRVNISRFRRREDEILLKGDLLDKQIVDIDGRKVVRANDVILDFVEGAMRLVAVDVGTAGLLRRLGLPDTWINRLSGEQSRVASYIDWEDVDPLGSTIASVRLRVPHAGLSELHPADLATIVDQLTPRDRADIFSTLDEEVAAEALERRADAFDAKVDPLVRKSLALMHPHHVLAQAITLIQIGIALASICALTKVRALFWASAGASFAGLLLAIWAWIPHEEPAVPAPAAAQHGRPAEATGK